MEKRGMTRKEKLEIWRARKGAETAPQSRLQNTLNSASSSLGKGVLAARPFPSNGVERAVSRRTKENVMRKPFQVDMRVVREASERRVAPGTPIHSLKKRLKRPGGEKGPAPAKRDKNVSDNVADKSGSRTAAASATTKATTRGVGSCAVPSARAHAKGMAVSSKVSGHAIGIRRGMDTARTKEVSEFLKSQISEANLLLEGYKSSLVVLGVISSTVYQIAGVDAARTLLADLLSATGVAGSVGELALYWAARAKLEEDAGMYDVARQTLDEGQAYTSIPTQQKVLEKVCCAFEDRMDNRAEKEVVQLLEDSTETLNSSSGNSIGDSNSPLSSTPFRYDPNELSVEDEGGGAVSAIKNLNFFQVAITEKARGNTSNASGDVGPEGASGHGLGLSEEVLPTPGASVGGVPLGEIDLMPGVICSDDDSDASIGNIDEAVIARAKAFNEEEEARNARMKAKGPHCYPDDTYKGPKEPQEAAVDIIMSEEPSVACNGITTTCVDTNAENTSTHTSMLPPQARGSKKRKGTPHPKPRRNGAPVSKDGEDAQAGTFITQVESKGKDGKRTLTPVRRSRRLSGSAQEPTPSPLRKEMEAML